MKSSVVAPDSIGFMDPDQDRFPDPNLDPGRKKITMKKLRQLMFPRAGHSLKKGERFSFSLKVLHGGLQIQQNSPLMFIKF